MKTTVYKLDGSENDIEKINICAGIIKNGGIVAFPTETVYGLGADAYNDVACRNIYKAKNRPAEKPLLCHLYSITQAEETAYLTDDMRKLIGAFTPGPLTVIAPKKDGVCRTVTAGGDTVGLRFPSNREALLFMEACGVPLAATSANISDLPAPTSGDEVMAYLDGRIDALLDAGKVGSGIASTIVTLDNGIKVLREGSITKEEIEEALK